MISFDFLNDHAGIVIMFLATIPVVTAIVIVIALLKKDNVKASGQYGTFGFSLEANGGRPRKKKRTSL